MKHARDAAFEARLRDAVLQNHAREQTALQTEARTEQPQIRFSQAHETELRRRITRAVRGENRRRIGRTAGRAAVILCAVVSVLFGLLLTSPDVRDTVWETIAGFFSDEQTEAPTDVPRISPSPAYPSVSASPDVSAEISHVPVDGDVLCDFDGDGQDEVVRLVSVPSAQQVQL